MNRPTRLYITHGPGIELEVTVVAREYNGIDSDPKVRLRQPTLEELHGCLDEVRGGDFRFVPDLNYPVAGEVLAARPLHPSFASTNKTGGLR